LTCYLECQQAVKNKKALIVRSGQRSLLNREVFIAFLGCASLRIVHILEFYSILEMFDYNVTSDALLIYPKD